MDNKQSNQVVEVEGKAKQVLAKHKKHKQLTKMGGMEYWAWNDDV